MSKAVVVKDLWEEFRIRQGRIGLKEAATRFRLGGAVRSVRALRGVTFDIEKGETVGLIGENGSGKSTLLRCIAGIFPPTRGEVLVAGTISSLIELGVDFSGDLTGRENLIVNGSLFGLTRKQLIERLDSIVAFAELDEEIDSPVRAYSSGMRVRLAFSLAVHVQPDVFLIDEALAVGDDAFQRRSARKVIELGEAGATIVFVSHDLGLVKQICRRSILLHNGEIAEDGETSEVIDRYLRIEREEHPDEAGG